MTITTGLEQTGSEIGSSEDKLCSSLVTCNNRLFRHLTSPKNKKHNERKTKGKIVWHGFMYHSGFLIRLPSPNNMPRATICFAIANVSLWVSFHYVQLKLLIYCKLPHSRSEFSHAVYHANIRMQYIMPISIKGLFGS
jgi:hypothetical protein